jgi:hypothetical protein
MKAATHQEKPARKKSARISNAARLRIFIGAALFLSAGVLVTSCRDADKKRSFTEVKGFNTPVQNQDISLPPTPPAGDVPAHGDGAMPDIPAHAGLAGVPAHGAASGAAAEAAPSAHLIWQLPKGWTAQAGSGMYYAILKTSADPSASQVGILSLPGEAGGLQANTERWMGQLGLRATAEDVSGFLTQSKKIKSTGNVDVTLLDFSSLVKDEEASSMMVAIAKPGPDSYFLKMVGKKSVLAKYKGDFAALCNTLVLE